MRVIVFGKGTIGTAIKKALETMGHEVVSVSRNSGDYRADIADKASLEKLFGTIGPFDAVANAASEAGMGLFETSSDEQWEQSLNGKLMGQINIVRTALPFISDKGSFTLVSGVLTEEYLPGGVASTTVNHAIEGFVQVVPTELPRGIRINCVSPTVVTESMAKYAPFFPGFIPVEASKVAQAYVRSITGIITGRILKVGF
ncbi:short chain dehydrogenase [Paenibacillus glycinis]|uniref:Short chain dehydrogenase n=1 Tax=Paenibacillus glycinis TaxID=2697035 RepID=A0ABW9XT65_9BACL|nr:short chain dehydrogenase [Paenibacillus glycinis]NBD25512.1 short chain dehydrogenase [Paenibacillus glycinis]